MCLLREEHRTVFGQKKTSEGSSYPGEDGGGAECQQTGIDIRRRGAGRGGGGEVGVRMD